MAQVRKSGVDTVILDDLPAEPSYLEAQKLVDQCKASGADFILAVGGGSVMDTAKLASILMTDEYGIKELLGTPGRAKKCIKTLMIPTTAGTGSRGHPQRHCGRAGKAAESGHRQHQHDRRLRHSGRGDDQAPAPEDRRRHRRGRPGHAIECWTSNKATPFSDLYALQALDMILNNTSGPVTTRRPWTPKTRCSWPASMPA